MNDRLRTYGSRGFEKNRNLMRKLINERFTRNIFVDLFVLKKKSVFDQLELEQKIFF